MVRGDPVRGEKISEPGRPREGFSEDAAGKPRRVQPAGWVPRAVPERPRAAAARDRLSRRYPMPDHDGRPPRARARGRHGAGAETRVARRRVRRKPRRNGGVRGRALLFPHLERRESVRAHEPRVVAQRRFLLLRRRRGRDRLVRHLRVRVRARRARGRSGRRRTPTLLEPTAECSSGERHETAARGFARLGTRRLRRDERRVFFTEETFASPLRESPTPNANANANANAKPEEEEEEEQPPCVCRLRRVRRAWARRVPPRRRRVAPARARAGARGGGRRGDARRRVFRRVFRVGARRSRASRCARRRRSRTRRER